MSFNQNDKRALLKFVVVPHSCPFFFTIEVFFTEEMFHFHFDRVNHSSLLIPRRVLKYYSKLYVS